MEFDEDGVMHDSDSESDEVEVDLEPDDVDYSDDPNILIHEGVARKSGRYPWGSGANPNQRNNRDFLARVDELKRKGLSETQIAEGMGMNSTQLRAARTIAKNKTKAEDIATAQKLSDKGLSNVAIGERMGRNESSVRALLNPAAKDKQDQLTTTANMLKDQLKEKRFLDIGVGTENYIGITESNLKTAVAMLQEEGYRVDTVKVKQLGTGKDTTVKVLSPPGTEYSELMQNKDKIRTVAQFSEDGGRSFLGIQPPLKIDPDRVEVKYGSEGGSQKDGVIELRRGVDDISLGKSRYAQVRIAVGDGHYLKGMAMYTDDLPDGVDIRFNTNKEKKNSKLDAMKPISDDPDSPFGAVVRQRIEVGPDGKQKVTSALNIVNEEGNWKDWSNNLSSQMLSKQSPSLAKSQLDLTYDRRKQEYDEIMALTNPAVRKKLLQSFADGTDAAAVHLKAAALPRQGTHVILPVNGLKPTEIYAPKFKDGETVALVRYPHGGKFEIPELVVNNRHPEAKRALGQARDAVGINSKVAERLSGADFDGDTVLVIPNSSKRVQSEPPLKGLKGFDPQKAYPYYEGMTVIPDKQKKMGDVSNLITDMTIKGAQSDEIARAVRHSMVVIDAEKHKLNYKQSYTDNNIGELKAKYQGSSKSGASTLISQASSEERVADRKPRSAKDDGPINKETGELMYTPTGATYIKKTVSKKTGEVTERVMPKTVKSTRMAEAKDANTLSSGTKMEKVYATHANKLKALSNQARKEYISTKTIPYSPSAKIAYKNEVNTLKSKLNTALKNKPLERHAQLLANSTVAAKRKAKPNMDYAELKKIEGQALEAARARTGAAKEKIRVTPREWEAIQSGAISNNFLENILDNMDAADIKTLATPRVKKAMNAGATARARSMAASGYTQAEIAEALGVSVSTLDTALEG